MSFLTFWSLLFHMMLRPPQGDRDAPEQTTEV
jgi:hypothetical protein